MPQNYSFLKSGVRRNLTAPAVLRAKPGTVVSIACISAGSITLNNCLTVAAATGGNQVAGTPAAMTAGQTLLLNVPCPVGIVASAVSGAFNVAMS